jgi:predicted nucleic acid-binding protein
VRTGSELCYLDASALVKLVVEEPESAALRLALDQLPRRVTSRLSVVELIRSVRRADRRLEASARRVLTGVDLVAATDRVLLAAALLEPANLRALDAIHVASALRERSALTAFVSYDARQLEAAAAVGLPCASPR